MREWLKEFRLAKGYTQLQLSKLVNVDKSLIGKYELGIRTPSTSKAKKIAEILDFPWTKFYED